MNCKTLLHSSKFHGVGHLAATEYRREEFWMYKQHTLGTGFKICVFLYFQVSHLNSKIAEDCEEILTKDKEIESLQTSISETVFFVCDCCLQLLKYYFLFITSGAQLAEVLGDGGKIQYSKYYDDFKNILAL